MIYRISIFITFIFLFLSCSKNKQDERLTHISEIVSESPEEALCCLDSIDYMSLSDADKHFYDFLTIKARDKAYIRHSSDSLFIRVHDYYSNHRPATLYPEVLYYGGRVYSDLGDYPTALQYFHMALDYLPPNTNNQDLRNRVLSQTGRLLNSLRLFEDAVPYIKSAIEINKQFKDTTSIVYNLQLLGGTYLRAGNYQHSEKFLKESLALNSKYSSPFQAAKSQMYLAAVKYEQEQIDSALLLIRNILEKVKPNIRNSALAYASNIYLKAGLLDTAYLYSLELIHSPDSMHKQIGYQVILSPKLRKFINPDTLDQYICEYRDLLETFYDENQNQLALNQQNLYNYQLHEREKTEAEKSNKTLWKWITGLVLTSVIMIIGILFLKNRDKNHIIELQNAIEYINRLEQELNISQNIHINNRPSETEELSADSEGSINALSILGSTKNSEQELREKLKNKLLSLYERSNEKPTVSHIILQSEPYQTLLDRIRAEKPIKEDDGFWNELEQVILECSPKFKTNLYLLTLGRLTMLELHTSLLIKCGIKPSQMTILLGRSNGAIISRRETLCLKVLDKKLGVKVIDGIIRLL